MARQICGRYFSLDAEQKILPRNLVPIPYLATQKAPPFSEDLVKAMLRLWMQSVDMDEGDLKRLHEICTSAGKSLRWADYLWLDFKDFDPPEFTEGESLEVVMGDPRGDGSSLRFWAKDVTSPSALPNGPTEFRLIDNRIAAVVELKSTDVDLYAKLEAAYKKGGRWSNQALKTLSNHIQRKLREAQKQISDTKRLLGGDDALGVVVIVDASPSSIPHTVSCGYINKTFESLDCVDCVVHLTNNSEGGGNIPHIAMKDPLCIRRRRLFHYFQMLFQSVRFDEEGRPFFPEFPGISSPIAQVMMDESARQALSKDWERALQDGLETPIRIWFCDRSRFRARL